MPHDPAARHRLDNKVAVITGGGTGIGEACADLFAAVGAHVVVAGRSEATLGTVARRNGGTPVVCDVRDAAQVQALFDHARSIRGTVDVLINNAGVPGPIAPVADVDLAAWRDCIEINLFGALHCLQV